MDQEGIQRAAEDLFRSSEAIAFTGAGISVESGIPDFRGATGLWSKYNPEEYATIEAFHADPEKVWKMLKEMTSLLIEAKPNPAHVGLAELEKIGKVRTIITQNVDGLHQAAGSQNVIEFHGSGATLSCLSCKSTISAEKLSLEDLPPTCSQCNTLMKPDVVFFGEPIPWDAYVSAMEAARGCDLVLVVGTSGVVYPAADIPITAKESGAKIIEINLEPTPLTQRISDYMIQGMCGEIVPQVVETFKKLLDR
ncbi:MAG: NAD-dependent protein deacylase [Proteobacteria bacterium]|nr:NAD-dependent protein deacylase [Pseudomonadota bacterium]NIS68014.1 NAD-dependent protein deacylase [Pseudomonadota bacterium]